MPQAVTCVRWLPTERMMSTLAAPESPEATLERMQKLAAELPEAETAETSMLLSDGESVSDMTPDVLEQGVSAAPKLPMDVEDEFNLADYDAEPVVNTSGYFQHLDADLRLNSKKDPLQNYDALSDSEDGEFYAVKTSDILFAAATAEEEQCYVEVYVHDTQTGALFVRQTFDLNAYPLTMEFCSTAADAAYLAVGTFDHAIELWDLRELCPDEPAALLGMPAPKKTKKKRPAGVKTLGHTDAVLSLSAGRGGVLVSGSADKTVRLWDVNTQKHISEFTHHSDKVQSVLVHPEETHVVLTASYDRCAAVLDMRISGAQATVKKIPIGAGSDPEAVMWISDYEFLVSTESGAIGAFDLRTGPVWTMDSAHDGACTAMAKVEGGFVSAGLDGVAKVWSLGLQGGPQLVKTKDMKTGPLFSVATIQDHAGFVAFAGTEAGIWCVEGGTERSASRQEE